MAENRKLQLILELKNKASKDLAGFNKQIKSSNTGLNSFAKKAALATGAVVAIGFAFNRLNRAATESAKTFAKYERSLNTIVGLVGVNREEVMAWKDDIRNLSLETGTRSSELAEAMFFITSAGLRGADALDVLESSSKAAAAGLGETKIVADLVTSAMNAYGKEVLGAEEATDILVATVRAGKAVPEELAQSLGVVLPIASNLGVSFDQVGAAIAGMTRTGTDASTAGTQLRQILFSILKPSSQAKDELERLGTSAGELRSQLKEEGLIRTLSTLKEMFNDNDEAAGLVFGNVRALSGVLDLLGGNSEENIAIFEELTETMGLTNKAFEATDDSARQLAQVSVAFENLKLAIGEALFANNGFLESIKEMLGGAEAWFNQNQDTVSSIANLITSLIKLFGWVLKVTAGIWDLVNAQAQLINATTKAMEAETATVNANADLQVKRRKELIAAQESGNEKAIALARANKDKALALSQELTQEELANIQKRRIAAQEAVDADAEASSAWKKVVVKNVSDVDSEVEKLLDDLTGGMPDASDSTNILTESVGGLADEYEKLSETAGDALFDIQKKQEETLGGLDEKIKNIKSSMSSLQQSFAKGLAGDKAGLAEEIVSAQDEVVALEATLAKTASQRKRTELEEELSQKREVLAQNAELINSMEAELNEARRRAGLTDLERVIEDFNKKRELAQEEFNKKMVLLKQEIKQVKEQRKKEMELFQEKVNFITAQQAELEKRHKETTDRNLIVTKEAIDQEIEFYRELAKAISAAKGSSNIDDFNRSVGKTQSVNDAVIAPGGKIISTDPQDFLIATKRPGELGGGRGINITITGNSFMGMEDAAEHIGDLIIGRLKLATNID